MKNSAGKVIYVGKAADLKNRLGSYFSNSSRLDAKTGVLVKHISEFETIVTASEAEALILESNLIKRHRPRYNVILKDDKRYPSLRIDVNQKYPNLTIVRRTKKDGALYFGPYPSAGAVRQTLKMIHRMFRLRKCRYSQVKSRERPCLNYQIGACLAPCCREVDPEEYRRIVNEVRMFLQGRTPDLIRRIESQMQEAAESRDFETAARLRDKMYALEKTMEKQVAVTTDFVDRDVIAFKRAQSKAVVMLLKVRNGYLQGMRDFSFSDEISADQEILGAFIKQYYGENESIPDEILTGIKLPDQELYGRWLSEIRNRKVVLRTPVRGEKARLVRMAYENAGQRLAAITEEQNTAALLLSGLHKRLSLMRYPRRIECVDNSGLFGTDLVAGLVVFEDGAPEKSDYRQYRIRQISAQDDYGCMREVLSRRFADMEKEDAMPKPDMLMVDGGKGQLNIALAVLKELGISGRFNVIGIAKKDERKGEKEDKIYLPGRANPINFQNNIDELHLLQRIRDEAHRRAISFHRKRRTDRSLKSALDDIPGIGKKRKEVLLKYYGSVHAIGNAPIDELAALPGMTKKAAETLRSEL
ncbi:MAG: excinuclease ABC subunit UvrC [Desulfobacteraceae bacterium]|nr:excinuclease ABC subunit UvrC [Desulfobacteraceae bacterium]